MHSLENFVPPPPCACLVAWAAASHFSGTSLRIGIIGAGMMGQEHIRNIALFGEDIAVVVAVAEADVEVRGQLKRELVGPCTVLTKVAGIISCDQLDAFMVCTPNCHP